MFTNLVHLFKTAQDAAERAYGSVLAAEKEAFADLGGGYTAMNMHNEAINIIAHDASFNFVITDNPRTR
jgi:hypothetical protein